jgi:1,2-diacylglycerol 3-alpha-glucosyltransferase
MQTVLFIYRGLQVGGIETFYCRLAENYDKTKFNFRFLFLCERHHCDVELLARLERSARVNFYSEYVGSALKRFACKLPVPLKILIKPTSAASQTLAEEVDLVHATEGLGILLAQQIFKSSNKRVKINLGFYHQKEFSWGKGTALPYFEKINRAALRALDSRSLAFFNEGVAVTVCQETGRDVSQVNVFPLGVDVARPQQKQDFSEGKRIKIVSIGRLTNFKTYNLWMIDVVARLASKGYEVSYDVYGRGDIEAEVADKVRASGAPVCLKGTLKYSEFSRVVSEYDLFVGSGTAIIEASALGVPAIIGIESIPRPETYGYFSNISGFTYNELGLDLPLLDVGNLIEGFASLSEGQKLQLGQRHVAKAELFSMEHCVANFSHLFEVTEPLSLDMKSYSWLTYRLSYITTSILSKLRKTSYTEKYN